eukprot:CAMPEP_0197441876 /NCGR_PEP_ID=MMETSP1175-20131217/8025_1 /TAXON_ID=1003142 /ORGANISM="Triceratium dubium, Strain CCMP147" /LENGTH=351 /DNA_ID=CAMNT_0042972233 /DNA_START=72 /DNA_END=1127 /DNA_ORIENTATION=+
MTSLGFLVVIVPLLLVCSATPRVGVGLRKDAKSEKRTIMAWATADLAAAEQIRNATWRGIFDGVHAFCGATVRPDGTGIDLNQSQWNECSPLYRSVRESGMKFYLVVGNVPEGAISKPGPVISAAMDLASKYDLDGFSLDDEYDCAPRSTLDRLRAWVKFVDEFAEALHSVGLKLSAAVQAMFGVQNVPYHPHCGPNKTPAECSQACDKHPSQYPLDLEVTQLMSESRIDRWLEMDTYYFTTGRFLNALDWYVDNVAKDKLGLAMMNRDDLTEDGLLARFYAIDKSGVEWINIFLLPASDIFLPLLKRWKTRCAGCGVQSVLGCYDLTIPCNQTQSNSPDLLTDQQERLLL